MLETIDTGLRPSGDPDREASPNGFVLECSGSDNRSRWTSGMRLDRLFAERARALADKVAVENPDGRTTSFTELDQAATRLAQYLNGKGIEGGSCVGILFDNGFDSYVAMLAVMRAGAAFVPLDLGFPKDRIAYILEDAAVVAVLTLSTNAHRLPESVANLIEINVAASEIGAFPPNMLLPDAEADDALCYIIYTSGTTGRPKGVQIDHSNICNFVLVATETYGILPRARMYQGLTIAFDFSFEEIWVPLFSGATLIPSPPGLKPVGEDLHAYLVGRQVTALCAVPTLLATVEEDLPQLDFLLVSGEACPQDLIARWWRPGRRFLNAYGPTEATVTATVSVVAGVSQGTIGKPLATYKVIILAPDEQKALSKGAIGEIALAGPGLSRGYLNRPDLTERAFIEDFLQLSENPTGTIYRTGDFGRINDDGEVEYHGRIDTQVKVRGYRIELTEIESVILAAPGIAQAVVEPWRPRPDIVELVAYYTLARDAEIGPGEINALLRDKLPPYMVPTYFERLDLIPMLPSDKADRKSLPVPSGERFTVEGSAYEAPSDGLERTFADLVGEMLGMSRVSATAHLFEELGANSLIIARLTARMRALRPGLMVSIKDVYLNPTVRSLAAAFGEPRARESHRVAAPPLRAGRVAFVATGMAQAGIFLASLFVYALLFIAAVDFIDAASSLGEMVTRSLMMGLASMFVTCGVPILAKWVLIGRWKQERFAVWGLKYLRFWTVRVLIRSNPLAFTAGTPLFTLYLRLLGARIGRNVVFVDAQVPLATDLLTVGDDTVIAKEAYFAGYRCENGGIEIGRIDIGRDCRVGENAVLDINVSISDGGQLAHASALIAGQTIPAGETWLGSPARRSNPLTRPVGLRAPARRRILLFTFGQIVFQWLVSAPIVLLGVVAINRLGGSESFHPLAAFDNLLVGSLAVYLAGILAAAASVLLLPRLAWMGLRTGQEYRLYGLRYWLFRVVAKRSNSKFFNILFGDSSFILHYLKSIGYRLSLKGQTGSNFGLVQRQDIPFATSVGDGTLVSDGLTISNAVFTPSSFRLEEVRLGSRSFFGNAILYPPDARTGDNCLLATKVMVPTSGPHLQGIGLLGSPPIEIPRSVRRDQARDIALVPGAFEQQLRLKNSSNLATIGLYLLSRWLLFSILFAIADLAFQAHGIVGAFALGTSIFAMTIITMLYYILLERLSLGFGRLSPKACSIYDPYYWSHERYWKLNDTTFIQIFNGTPFKGIVWRLLGVKWGRMNFDDGCLITERTLVSVGDNNTFGEMTVLQSHSLEDGAFKSDVVTVGNGCTVTAKGYVSYATRFGDRVLVEPDSFVMKGEVLEAGSVWGGNPARNLG